MFVEVARKAHAVLANNAVLIDGAPGKVLPATYHGTLSKHLTALAAVWYESGAPNSEADTHFHAIAKAFSPNLVEWCLLRGTPGVGRNLPIGISPDLAWDAGMFARLETPLRQLAELANPEQEAPEPEGEAMPKSMPSGKLSPRELADKHGVGLGALSKRLYRWRCEHDAGYFESSNAKRNEPKYLYDESAVMPVIDELKAKAVGQKRATNVQRKKI